MFQGSHVVMVSQRGLPTSVNLNSLIYPQMVQSGNYTQITNEPVNKKEAEQICEDMIREITDFNE